MAGTTYKAQAIISAHDRASKVFAKVGRNSDRMARKVSKVGLATAAAAARATRIASLAAAAGVGLAIKRAADFEDKMADVRKVMEFDKPEQFEQLGKNLIELSKRLPNTAADLAAITAIAGQAGTAQKDLAAFTELSAKSSIAFGMSAENTADALAQIREQLQLSQTELAKNVDVTNALANNFNTTEGKLLDFNKRVAASGKLAGFANSETQAFGTSMIAMGAESNVAATSFRNLNKTMTAGDAATKSQRKGFKKLGLDAKKVAKAMQKDAVGTVVDLLEKLNKLPKEAQGATALQLFGSEARALTPLITNLDLLRRTIALANDEKRTAGAVDKEFATRMRTTTEQAKLFRNRLDAVFINLGAKFLPAINRAFGPVAAAFENTVGFMVDRAEDLEKVLDGLATGMGFDGITGALSKLGEQFDLLFGSEKGGDRGEALARAFHAGETAGQGLMNVINQIKEAYDSLMPAADALSTSLATVSTPLAALAEHSHFFEKLGDIFTGGNIASMLVWAAGISLTAGAIGSLGKGLFYLTTLPFRPIVRLVKMLGQLAGFGIGLAATATALTKIGKVAAPATGVAAGATAKTAGAGAAAVTGGKLAKVGRFAKLGARVGGGIVGLVAMELGTRVVEDIIEQTTEAGRAAIKARKIDRNRRHAAADKIFRQKLRNNPAANGVGIHSGFEQRFGKKNPTIEDRAGNKNVGSLNALLKELADVKGQFKLAPSGNIAAEIMAPVEAELKGKADIAVRIAVEGPGKVVGAAVTSSGNLAPSVGTDQTATRPVIGVQ